MRHHCGAIWPEELNSCKGASLLPPPKLWGPLGPALYPLYPRTLSYVARRRGPSMRGCGAWAVGLCESIRL
eukprot:535290-Prymnesium_polylepis.1